MLTTRIFLACVTTPTTSGSKVTLTSPASSAFMAITLPTADLEGSTRPPPTRDGPNFGGVAPGKRVVSWMA